MPHVTITEVTGTSGFEKGFFNGSRTKKKPRRGGGAEVSRLWRACYFFSLRRTRPAIPISPVPSRPRVPGSGTVTVVTPLLRRTLVENC